jgi:hypothetical protein
MGRGKRLGMLYDELFSESVGVSILGTQENDHPIWLHSQISNPNIDCLVLPKYNVSGKSNSAKFLKKRLQTASAEYRKPYEETGGVHDDTISVYFDRTKVTYDSHVLVPISEKKGVKTQVGIVKFVTNDEQAVPFYAINGHLKSGEKPADAQQRLLESAAVMEYCNTNLGKSANIVLLFDSNSSDLYQSADGSGCRDEIFHHWQDNGFTQLILPKTGHECLKMRHGSGGQPKKFGQFMFDTIDKSAVRGPGVKGEAFHIPLKHFQMYHECASESDIAFFHSLRSDPEMRAHLAQTVTDEMWSDQVGCSYDKTTKMCRHIEDNDILSQRRQMCLYPNTRAPSDHPPILVKIFLFPVPNDPPSLPMTASS